MNERVNFGEGIGPRNSAERLMVALLFCGLVQDYRRHPRERDEILAWLATEEAQDLARFVGLPTRALAAELRRRPNLRLSSRGRQPKAVAA